MKARPDLEVGDTGSDAADTFGLFNTKEGLQPLHTV